MERSIWAVTVATFTLRFATGLTGALLVFFLADLPEHGGPAVGPFVLATFTGLFFAAELILSPPFGLLSDRVGHHRIMQVGPVLGAVAVILTALVAELHLPGSVVIAVPFMVGSLPVLGLTRVLEGGSTAASVPSVLGFVAMVTAGDEALRGRAAARFEAATIAGLALGLVVAGPAWATLGPSAFLVNAVVYAAAWGMYRYGVPARAAPVAPAAPLASGARPDPSPPSAHDGRLRLDWRRYGTVLRAAHVWLLAPTWVALNAVLGLYTSQTLFQLVREPDPEFADQTLAGGLEPIAITAAIVLGGLVFFAGLWYWGGRFGQLRRTTIIGIGIAGGFVSVAGALLLNHGGGAPIGWQLAPLVGLGVGVFLMAGATPAALGLLADMSEPFPDDRGAIMGLYSVFLALGQIGGAFVGAVAAEGWAVDGILVATVLLLALAVAPLARLRRFELAFEPSPASGPDVRAKGLLDVSGESRGG